MIKSLVLCGMGLLVLLFGKVTIAQPQEYAITQLTTSDGLSHRMVTSIVQDQEGYLWFGTFDGLNRYDGHRFTVYRSLPGDTTTLSESLVTALLVDREGTLWVGTATRGLNRFDRKTETFTHYRHHDADTTTLSHDHITTLTQGRDNTIWVGTEEGLNLLDVRTGRITRFAYHLENKKGVLGQHVVLSKQMGGDNLWVQYFHLGTILALTPPPQASAPVVEWLGPLDFPEEQVSRDFLVDHRGTSWILIQDITTRQVSLVQPDLVSERHAFFPIAQGSMFAPVMTEGEDGHLWVGADHAGLYRFDTHHKTLTHFPFRHPNNTDLTIYTLFYDASGLLWIGTSKGVWMLRLLAPSLQSYRHVPDQPNSLEDNRLNNFLVDREGILWIATNTGLNRIDRQSGQVTHYRHDPRDPFSLPPRRKLWSLYEDRKANLWIGMGWAGLWRMDRSTGRFEAFVDKHKALAPILGVSGIFHIREDSSGHLWISTTQNLVRLEVDTGNIQTYLAPPSPHQRASQHQVHYSLEDRAGIVWAGTQNGLIRLDPSTGKHTRYLTDASRQSRSMIWTLHLDRRERLWIGTIGDGLIRFDPETDHFTYYTTASGLPSNVIYGILEADDGSLWMSTNNGLVRFDPVQETFEWFNVGDGLPSKEFDLMAYYQTPQGEMFFGGPEGGVSFFPQDMARKSTAVPPVVITGFHVFDKPYRPGFLSDGAQLTLAHFENFFTFHFAALDYFNPSKNQYRYRLEGYDTDWRTTDGRRPEASYTRVPPGNYTFVVAGSNHDGVFSDRQVRVFVRIVPVFWQTLWFRVVLGTIALALVVGAFYRLSRRQVKTLLQRQAEEQEIQQRLLESRDRERVRVAHDLHDGPMQTLYSVSHDLERLSDHLDAQETPSRLQHVRGAVLKVTAELRDICQALRPPIVEQMGLRVALDALARRFHREQPQLRCILELHVEDGTLPSTVQASLYRIAQEALSNVARHAQAREVIISLTEEAAGVVFQVRDNGKGFKPPESLVDLARQEHFGLIGMMERAAAMGGSLKIHAIPEQGTTLEVQLPASILEAKYTPTFSK